MKVLLFFILLTSSNVALSCFGGNAFGPKYNQLVKVTQTNIKNEFKIIVPERLSFSINAKAYLVKYTAVKYEITINGPVKKRLENGENVYRIEMEAEYAASQPESSVELPLEKNGNKMQKTFRLDIDKKYIHIIRVHWEAAVCCFCSTDANTGPLENISKDLTN